MTTELVKDEKIWSFEGDEATPEAFAGIYDRFSPQIYRHILSRVGHREAAEDITAQVFLKTWDHVQKTGESIKNIRAFLFHIAHNLVTDHYRKKYHETIALDSLPEHHPALRESGTIEKKLEERELVSEVEAVLLRLSPEYRDILVWRYVDELSVEEIVVLSGKTPNAIYVTLHRALTKVRVYLAERSL